MERSETKHVQKRTKPEGSPPPMPKLKSIPSAPFPDGGVLQADVVIIGGGGAGIPAALTCLEKGVKRVVLIEKRDRVGGNAIMARGIFGCESSILRNAMIKTDKDKIFTNAMRWHHYDRVNPRLLREYINRSGDTIEWLLSKGLDMYVDTTTRMNYNQDPTWHCVKGGSMAKAMGILFDEALQKGLICFFHTQVMQILKEDNKVIGVRARNDAYDRELIVKAKSVILATGGFLSNEELVKSYFPFYSRKIFGGFMTPNMGEGIGLVRDVGGATEYYATLIKEACAPSDNAPRFLTEFCREPYHMWVNKKGRRFVEESAGAELQICTNALLMQPELKAFTIFDENIMKYMMHCGMELSKGDDMRGHPIPDLKNMFERATLKSPETAAICESIETLASWIGCKKEMLYEEIERYNSFCTCGYDKDFNKERRYLREIKNAPFYVIMHQAICVDTIGPVRIDERTRVLDQMYDPIEGLYSAGVITSGWQSSDYCGNYLFGSALSYSINSGRMAGEEVADFIHRAESEI